jgi:hypothetical protein
MNYLKFLFVFCLGLILLPNQRALGQNPYYDAIKLRKLVNPNSHIWPGSAKDAVAAVLADYTAKDSVIDLFTNNPFTRQLAGTVFVDRSAVAGGQNAATLFGAIGDFNVTTIADGFAKFLVQRTKEELSVAFFVQIKEDLDKPEFVIVQTLFPHTKKKLDQIGTNIYQYTIYLTDLRNAFNADLEDMATTFPYILNIPKYKSFFAKYPWIEPAIETGIALSEEFVPNTKAGDFTVTHVGKVIADLGSKAGTYFPAGNNDANTSMNGMVKTLALISASFHSTDTSRYWVSYQQIGALLKDPVAFQIYLGLVYQQAVKQHIEFAGKDSSVTLQKILTDISGDVNKIAALNTNILAIAGQLNLFDEDFKDFSSNLATLSDAEKIAKSDAIFNNGTGILQAGLSMLTDVDSQLKADKLSPINLPADLSANAATYAQALQDAVNLYFNVKQRKFTVAITSATDLLTLILKESPDKKIANTIQKITTYGEFFAQMANAKNSNEVDSIITNTVLPPGSSYIKKHAVFNIALQAYTGIYGGVQQTATDKSPVGSLGITAPVGLAFSWGGPKNSLNPGSFTVFVSVIDLGPLVSYRFKNANDTLANNVNVRLSQIVSPGLHLIWGIPKLPLSIGAGFTYIPLLTDVETASIKVNNINNSPFRAQLFIAVDIPLLNFHNNPR